MSRTTYIREYMRERRANNPLQRFQDRRDNFKAKALAARTFDTLVANIEAYGQACIELDAARKLYKTK